LSIHHSWNAKRFLRPNAIIDQLDIPRFKNVQIQPFLGKDNNVQRENGQELRHANKNILRTIKLTQAGIFPIGIPSRKPGTLPSGHPIQKAQLNEIVMQEGKWRRQPQLP
jgi:hypothetical protein